MTLILKWSIPSWNLPRNSPVNPDTFLVWAENMVYNWLFISQNLNEKIDYFMIEILHTYFLIYFSGYEFTIFRYFIKSVTRFLIYIAMFWIFDAQKHITKKRFSSLRSAHKNNCWKLIIEIQIICIHWFIQLTSFAHNLLKRLGLQFFYSKWSIVLYNFIAISFN